MKVVALVDFSLSGAGPNHIEKDQQVDLRDKIAKSLIEAGYAKRVSRSKKDMKGAPENKAYESPQTLEGDERAGQ